MVVREKKVKKTIPSTHRCKRDRNFVERRNFSLSILEIMIVILLISIIGGSIGYNLKGSLDKGRAFKTVQAKEQLRELLLLYVAEGKATVQMVAKEPLKYLKEMSLAKKPEDLLVDGWNVPFEIKIVKGEADFRITSKKYDKYMKDHGEKQEDKESEAEEE